MPWPFQSVDTPTGDSGWVTLTGSFVDVPNVSAAAGRMGIMWVLNTSAAEITFEIQETSGPVPMLPPIPIAAKSWLPNDLLWSIPFASKPQWKGNGLKARMLVWQ